MKVLFIASWYPNSTNPLKGIFIKKHAEAIKKAGVEIEVLALTVSYSKKLFERNASKTKDENGVTTHLIEVNSRFYKLVHVDLLLQFTFVKKYFYKEIKPTFTPDIIHSNVLFPSALMGYWLARKEKLPHVITEHWSKVDNFFSKSLYAKAGKKAYNSARFVTVVSEFLRKNLSKHFETPEKLKVISNVVDTDIFSFKTKAVRDRLIFGCVAHWTGGKRPDLLFTALQKFSKVSSKPVILNVIGEGPLIEELKSKTWGFEVHYLGNLFRKQIAEKLQECDYFLHASNMETFSIVIAEALVTGTPVLASRVGAVPELVNDSNGILCDNTIEAWKAGLDQITQKKYDHHLISKNSDRYGQVMIGNEFKELYKSLIPI